MGLFGKAKTKTYALQACSSGTVVGMKDIPDSVFSDGILGICLGIEPDHGTVVSPCDGVITQVAETFHALGLKTDFGAEILIHAGIDTVQMLGEGFFVRVSEGERVKAGQMLLGFDPGKVRDAGYGTTVITAVTNSGEFAEVKSAASGRISAGDTVLEIRK